MKATSFTRTLFDIHGHWTGLTALESLRKESLEHRPLRIKSGARSAQPGPRMITVGNTTSWFQTFTGTATGSAWINLPPSGPPTTATQVTPGLKILALTVNEIGGNKNTIDTRVGTANGRRSAEYPRYPAHHSSYRCLGQWTYHYRSLSNYTHRRGRRI